MIVPPASPKGAERLVIRLEAHGEFYGFICLSSRDPDHFNDEVLEPIRKALPVLSHSVAEAVFSMRLRILAAPFRQPSNNGFWEESLYEEIVRRTAAGFAADGAVLRLYDTMSDLLTAKAWCGQINSELLEPKALGEGITGTVLAHPTQNWALAMQTGDSPDSSETVILGVDVPAEDRKIEEMVGLKSYLVMRLTSEVRVPSEQPQPLGTLSFCHRRRHRFSWREIAAFKSYCQRVADTISLYRTFEDLNTTVEMLRIQGQALTRVEIVARLTHDLGHKVFASCNDINDYIGRVRKSMNNRREQRTHDHLEPYAERAIESALRVQASLDQIRTLYRAGPEEFDRVTEFDVCEVIAEIQETLYGALHRNNIKLNAVYLGSLRVRGRKSVLAQALFNLFLNSIEAIRTRRTGKTLSIHIHASLEQSGISREVQDADRRVVIQFWDDGPGISHQHFPDANRIFEIGQTSRSDGTGAGLPAARSLIGRYFGGMLTLEDRNNARFRITIPVR